MTTCAPARRPRRHVRSDSLRPSRRRRGRAHRRCSLDEILLIPLARSAASPRRTRWRLRSTASRWSRWRSRTSARTASRTWNWRDRATPTPLTRCGAARRGMDAVADFLHPRRRRVRRNCHVARVSGVLDAAHFVVIARPGTTHRRGDRPHAGTASSLPSSARTRSRATGTTRSFWSKHARATSRRRRSARGSTARESDRRSGACRRRADTSWLIICTGR